MGGIVLSANRAIRVKLRRQTDSVGRREMIMKIRACRRMRRV